MLGLELVWKRVRVAALFLGLLLSLMLSQIVPLLALLTFQAADRAAALSIVGVAASIAISFSILWFGFVLPAKRALQAEASKLAVIMGSAAEGIVTANHAGIIQSFNTAAETMFGYPASEVVGKHMGILVPENRRDAFAALVRRYLLIQHYGTVINSWQATACRRNGTEFDIEISVSEVSTSGGRVFTGIVRDVTERRQWEEKIRTLAHSDELTALPNRALFFDRMAHAMAQAKRYQRKFALLYLDLNRFKPVNDTLGHAAGDELLRLVALRLRERVREADTMARLGGDEFAAIITGVMDMEDARKVAEKITDSFSTPFLIDKHSLEIGASVGVALYPDDAVTVDRLMAIADERMYEAKGSQERSHGELPASPVAMAPKQG